nr:MAG: replication associated protein [ssDNA virus sp.]
MPVNEVYAWCFTLNNPTEEERGSLKVLPRGIAYLIWQEERGENGTVHLQGYLEGIRRVHMQWLKNNFNARAHFETRRGTQEEAIAYCRKDDTYTGGDRVELGEKRVDKRRAAEESKRERIEALDKLRRGEIRFRDLESEQLMHSGFLQAAKTILSTSLGPYRPNLRVITILGGSGVGKSYICNKIGGDELITYQGRGWFGNAQSQGDCLLFDEFTGGIPFDEFMRYLDPYRNQLPVKGTYYPACYTTVFITTNVAPELWWVARGMETDESLQRREDNRQCLYRRIGYCGPQREYPQYENGCFIDLRAESDPLRARAVMKNRLLMLGFDLREE